MKRKFLVLVAMLAVVCWASAGSAAIVTLTYPMPAQDTSNVQAASAYFSLDTISHELTITLTNTSTVNTPDNADVLYALFWQGCTANGVTNVETTGTIYETTGSNTQASVVTGAAADLNTAGVGGGATWGYAGGMDLSGYVGFGSGLYNGVSAVGYGLNAFPSSIDGAGYGIVSDGFDYTDPQDGVTKNNPEIMNSVVLTLDGWSGDDLSCISNVVFSYGTALSPVPIPPSALLLGSGLLGLLGLGWRRRRS